MYLIKSLIHNVIRFSFLITIAKTASAMLSYSCTPKRKHSGDCQGKQQGVKWVAMWRGGQKILQSLFVVAFFFSTHNQSMNPSKPFKLHKTPQKPQKTLPQRKTMASFSIAFCVLWNLHNCVVVVWCVGGRGAWGLWVSGGGGGGRGRVQAASLLCSF